MVKKTSASVFPTTDLDVRLKAAGIDTLIVTGLMTHACVAGAARDAVPLGYAVIVVGDACATLPALDDTFGDVLTTEQVLKFDLIR